MSIRLIYAVRKFWPLFWTQFFGALNDNLLKNALIMMMTYKEVQLWGFDHQGLVALSGGVFILPFFLFSSFAGQLADKYEKTHLIKIVKVAEIGIMGVATYGFFEHQFSLLIGTLFLMGLHSTLFGPVKFSIIPDLVSEEELVAANAYIELGTFLAILVGTIVGGILISRPDGERWVSLGLLASSVVGLVMSLFLKPTPQVTPDLKINWNPFSDTLNTIKLCVPNKSVFYSIFGISWFWFFGASLLSLLPVYVKDLLHGGEGVVTLFLTCFTVGIAVGAVLSEKLSFKQVELGIVPLGSFFMTVFLADLAFITQLWNAKPEINLLTIPEFWKAEEGPRILLDLFFLSVSGGVFTIPLYTLIQKRSQADIRSRIISANNILNSLFMVASALCITGFHSAGLSIPEIFLSLAIMNLATSIYIYSMVTEFTLRFLSWLLVHVMYRVKAVGRDHIPFEGAAILVCNHVSFVDWLVIGGLIRRPIRFVMYYKFAKNPILKFFLKQAKVIPIAGAKEDPDILKDALKKISEELRDGNLVCIFPEGKLTPDGSLSPFRNGIETMIQNDPVPVIPMALLGLWGSFFSHSGGKAMAKIPRRFWHPVNLIICPQIAPQDVQANTLQTRVQSIIQAS